MKCFEFQSLDMQIHLEAKLRKQQMESEVDSRWLQQEENNLVSYDICLLVELHLLMKNTSCQ